MIVADREMWNAEHFYHLEEHEPTCDDCGADPCYCDEMFEKRFEK